ncbi:hypothetical protein CABS01_11790 [Colletotrichum abscissum]|uniref:Aflatoxin regulatory protein domain-containing protein n=1 Tax=Colletotrichum abscissum TaxID=1671311 RepID=A0A9P9XA98_9PEZI|nr:uncharacterized protein CABS01_11790 [Colletotrichum abscissum]KAI3545128.1 hypothetical protein CABS02_09471 [Colletotrichum abscissum]KAK1492893.1 hypothetical protein CABS01_11790 [Colletotrichum abscissum]
MTSAELIPAQQTYPFVTPTDSGEQDWPDFLTALMEPYTSTELDSVGVSLDTFTYVEDSALNLSPSLSRLAQSHTSDRTRVQAAQHASSVSGSVTSSSDFMPGSLARPHGSSTDETTFFPPSPQIASGGASSESKHTCAQHYSPSRTGSSASRPTRRCQCLMRLLDFMAQLSIEPSQAWDAAPDGEPSTINTHSTSLELVSKGIRNISDGLDKILQCPCSHDTFLLLLVIFKIQACYIDAVNAITSEDDGGGVKNFRFKLAPQSSWNDAPDDDDDDDDGEDSGDEDQRRIFIHYVLSRLAGLRTLIIRLSERLVEPKTFPSEARRPTVPQGPPYYSVVEGKIEITPLPASSLCTLASDLHNRLKGMSQAMSEKLREV